MTVHIVSNLNFNLQLSIMPSTEVFPSEIRKVSEGDTSLLLLALPSDGRQIPVVIGDSEAESIILALQAINTERPMTHKLMCNIMQEYGLTLKDVSIDRFEEGIYFSTLTVSDGFNEKRIDSRTSDAVTLAMLQHAPIYASQQVVDETAIEPLMLDGGGNMEQATEAKLSQLEVQLQECLEREDYEQAAAIQTQIERLKKTE